MADLGNLGYTVNFDDSQLEEGLNKAILKAEKLNEQLSSLTDIKMPAMNFADLPTTAVDNLIGRMDELVKKMEEVRTGGNKKAKGESQTEQQNREVSALIQNLNNLDAAYRRIQNKTVLSKDDANSLKEISREIDDVTEALRGYEKGIKELEKRELTKPIKDLIAETNTLIDSNKRYNTELSKTEAQQQKIADKLKQTTQQQRTASVLGLSEESYQEVSAKITAIQNRIAELNQIKATLKVDSQEYIQAQKQVDDLQKTLYTLRNSLRSMNLGDLLKIEPKSIREASQLIQELSVRRDTLNKSDKAYLPTIIALNRRQAELIAQNKQLVTAGLQIESSQNRTRQTVEKTNKQFQRQSLLVTQLFNTLRGFAGFYFARDAVKQLAEIRGQFELQQVALRAIVQDAERADQLFNQIKSLAPISPFQFKDLVSYTKQLAAFQIPVDDLYDTMKRLADVSAGLGVDMGRLILAYGQIRSAGVLRGQELRQLTEAGIPALEMLRKKLEEVRGTSISLGEVFDAISSRQIPFEYIAEMFQDLTSESGIFFEMQEKQASTLYGIMSNLKDNYQLMLNEIGEANDGFLKGALNALVELMANWRQLADIIETAIVGFGAFKVLGILSSVGQFLKLTKNVGSAELALRALSLTGNKTARSLRNLTAGVTAFVGSWSGVLSILAVVGTYLYNSYSEAKRFNDALDDINSKGLVTATNLVSNFDKLYDKLKNSAQGSQDFRDAINQLNKEYKQYLPNILTEENALETLAQSYDRITDAIYKRIQAMSYEQGMQKIAEKYGAAVSESYQDIISNMVEQGFSPEQVRKYGSIIQKTVKEGLTGQIAGEDIFGNAIFKDVDQVQKILSKLKLNPELPESLKEMSQELRNFIRDSDLLKQREGLFTLSNQSYFGTGLNMDDFNDQMKQINDHFKSLEIEARKATMPVEDLKKRLEQISTDKLKEMLQLYKDFNMQDKVNEITLKLSDKTLTGFRKDVNAVIKRLQEELNDSKLAITWVATPDKDFDTYISDIRNRYKEINDKLKDRSKYDLTNAQAMKNELYAITEIAKQLGIQLETQKKIQSEEDKRIQSIKEQFNTLKAAVEEYKKLSQVMSEEGATKTTQEKFSVTFGFDEKSINDQYNSIIKKLASLQSKGAQTLLSTVKLSQSKTQTDYISGAIKNSIKQAEDMIKNYKPKFNLYEKLLGLTNDTEFAIQFAFEGVAPNDIIENMKNMFQSISGVPFTLDMDLTQFSPAIQQLGQLLQKNLEDQRDTAIKNFASLLAEYQSYEDKRTSIMMEAQRNREAILNNDQLTDSQKSKGIEATNTKERQDLAKNAFDQFKDTDLYRKAFEDLGNVAGTTLDYLIQKLEQFARDSGTALSVTDFKNLTSVIEDLKEQARENNPFDAFINSITEYRNALAELTYAQQVYAAAQETGSFAETTINADTGEEETRIITLAEANERLMRAQNAVATSANNVKKSSSALSSKFSQINQRIRGFADSMTELGDAMDNDFIKTVGEIVNVVMDIGDAVGAAITGLGDYVKASADAMLGVSTAAATAISTIEKASVILAIISAAMKAAMALANLFSKKNKNLLEESRRNVESLQSAYSRLSTAVEHSLGDAVFHNLQQQYRNLTYQKAELERQLSTRGEKGGLDDDEYEDVKNQLADLEQQLLYFKEEVAKDVYGIDLKGWADDIASSLVDAFSKGEDAAKAFEDTVADIMRTVVKNLIRVSIIEPAMQDVQKYLTDLYGKYSSGGGRGDIKKFMNMSKEDIAGLSGHLLNLTGAIDDSQLLFDYLNEVMGGILTQAEDVEEEGLAQGIQGVTEDTAEILAGLLQGMRAEMVIQSHYLELIQQALITGNSISTSQLSILTEHLNITKQIRDAIQSVLTIAVDGSAFRVVLSAS